MIKLLSLSLCLWAAISATAIARADTGYAASPEEPAGEISLSQTFQLPAEFQAFGKIREINQMQMQFSQLALRRSANQTIRRFASRVYAQYSYSDRELTSIARAMNMPLVNFPTSGDELKGAMGRYEKLLQLSILSGQQLDAQFVTLQVDYQKGALSSIESFLGSTTNEYAKRYLTKTKDTISRYYEEAQKLKSGLR